METLAGCSLFNREKPEIESLLTIELGDCRTYGETGRLVEQFSIAESSSVLHRSGALLFCAGILSPFISGPNLLSMQSILPGLAASLL